MTFHAFLPVGPDREREPRLLHVPDQLARSCALRVTTNRSVSLRRLVSRAGVPSCLGRAILPLSDSD